MQTMKKLFFSIFCMTIMALSVNAQKGYLKQEITEISSDDEQMAMMLEMMKGTQTEYFYSGDKHLSKASMMGGMVETKSLFNGSTGDVLVLINAMGQKMMVESTDKEMEKMNADQAEQMSKMDIVYDENDTKEIAGFKCIKATIKHPEMEDGMSFVMYVAPEVKANNRMIQGMQFFELKGFPLEFTMDMGQMKMTSTTVEFKEDFDDSVFSLDKSGYQKKTFEELMQMGGGGFGF